LLLGVCFIIKSNVQAQSSNASLNHIAIHVFDLQKSGQFYTGTIGLDTIPEPFHDGNHIWLSIGYKSHLHLIGGAKPAIDRDKNTHLCFTVQSVEKFLERLDKIKWPYEDWAGKAGAFTTRVDGVKQVYFRDPDGYWIEVNDARE
ncbi:MAG: VOC family protein, partial [Chitinophagaceae bacterium]